MPRDKLKEKESGLEPLRLTGNEVGLILRSHFAALHLAVDSLLIDCGELGEGDALVEVRFK